METTNRWLEEFQETGLLYLAGAIPDADVGEMREHLWAGLERIFHTRRDDRATWPVGKASHLQSIEREGAFAKMASPALCEALDVVFAPTGWSRPQRWGGLLVNFPDSTREWNVPSQSWHLDVGEAGVQGARHEAIVFVFLDTVSPGGGGTIVVRGSHRLAWELAAARSSRVNSAQARKLLAEADPWLRDLSCDDTPANRIRRFMEEGAVVQGIPLKVVELTGAPGDVVMMHPSLFHAASPNCSAKPRLVVRQVIFPLRAASGA